MSESKPAVDQVHPGRERESMPRLPYFCSICHVQQHASGMCANCGAAGVISTVHLDAAPSSESEVSEEIIGPNPCSKCGGEYGEHFEPCVSPTPPASAQTEELLPCEEWRPLVHDVLCDYYEVSSHGRVRSIRNNGRIVKEWPDKDGYLRVSFSVNRKSYCYPVHTLVALAFVGPRPEGQECSHKDGNKLNNLPGNLLWETHLENEQRKTAQGARPFGERNHASRLTAEKVKELRARWDNGNGVGLTTLAREQGMSQTALYEALKGTTWKHI